MKFKNKITNKIVEADTYTKVFAFTHNSNWEEVKESPEPKEPTRAEVVEKLKELNIEFDNKAKKEDLIKLLPEVKETEEE